MIHIKFMYYCYWQLVIGAIIYRLLHSFAHECGYPLALFTFDSKRRGGNFNVMLSENTHPAPA
jgi:hypothetical protein